MEQLSQGEGSGKAKVDLKHQNKFPIFKVEQVKKKTKKEDSQNPNVKDDVGLKSERKLTTSSFNKFLC